MKRKAILLCDFGLDDAVAVAFLLEHKQCFNGIDIVPIGGNVPFVKSFANGRKLLQNYNGDLDCVRFVDASNIKHHEEALLDIHGADGMGNVLQEKSSFDMKILPFDVWINGINPNETTLVSLGPCTVAKIILQTVGAINLLIMGGNINEEPNFHGYEFNHALDREAFAYAVKFPHKVATLDTCRIPQFNTILNPSEGERLFMDLQQASIACATKRHSDRCYIYDFIAVQSLVYPDSFTTEQMVDKDGNVLSVLKYKL